MLYSRCILVSVHIVTQLLACAFSYDCQVKGCRLGPSTGANADSSSPKLQGVGDDSGSSPKDAQVELRAT
jgi:hypothetical protein